MNHALLFARSRERSGRSLRRRSGRALRGGSETAIVGARLGTEVSGRYVLRDLLLWRRAGGLAGRPPIVCQPANPPVRRRRSWQRLPDPLCGLLGVLA